MATNVIYKLTEEADVLFMAAAKPTKNTYITDKEVFEYAIKLRFLKGSETVDYLSKVVESKVYTRTNMKLEDGEKHISFKSRFQPIVLDATGKRLIAPPSDHKERDKLKTEELIPYFNGMKDKARATVFYMVDLRRERPTVYLKGIKILSLEKGPEEEYKSTDTIIDEIKQFLN